MSMSALTRTTPWTNVSDSWSFLLTSTDMAAATHFLPYDAPTLLLRLQPDARGASADLNDSKINASMVGFIQASLIGGGMSATAANTTAQRIVNSGSGGLYGTREILKEILTAAIAAG